MSDPTSTTVTDPLSEQPVGQESSLSNWAGPYVESFLEKGWALSETPYDAYTGILSAPISSLQDQAFQGIAGLTVPQGTMDAANKAGAIGDAAMGMSYDPYTFSSNYTPTTFDAGYTPTDFSGQTGRWTDPGVAESYMNPYIMEALNPQLDEIRRQAEITRLNDASRLTQAGAFGGSRQAIMESEGWDNMARLMAEKTGQGYLDAYNTGANIFGQDENRALEAMRLGDQANQFGANIALKAQELGDSSNRFLSEQDLKSQELSEGSRQFGANYGLDALDTSLKAALAQGELSGDQLDQLLSIYNTQLGAGEIERGIIQEGLDADYEQWLREQEDPYKKVQFAKSLIEGLPLEAHQDIYSDSNWLTDFASGSSMGGSILDIIMGMYNQ